jgi:hypothetical protein
MEKEPNPKIFYVYGGAILVFKGNFFQHLNQNICPPVFQIYGRYLFLLIFGGVITAII